MSLHSLVIRTDQGTLVLALLISIPAVLHASAKLFNARWRPDSVEESRTKSSANSRRLILQFPIVAHSSAWLHLSIEFMQTMKRGGDKTHPCRSPTPTWNGFDCLPFTRTQNLQSAVELLNERATIDH